MDVLIIKKPRKADREEGQAAAPLKPEGIPSERRNRLQLSWHCGEPRRGKMKPAMARRADLDDARQQLHAIVGLAPRRVEAEQFCRRQPALACGPNLQ